MKKIIATILLFLLPTTCFGAIALVTAQTRQVFTASTSFTSTAMNCTGADFLVVATLVQDSTGHNLDTVSSMKFGGASTTLAIFTPDPDNTSDAMAFFILANPPTGSQTTVVQTTQNQTMRFTQSCYSGVNAVSAVNASGSFHITSIGSPTLSLTTTVAGAWLIATNIQNGSANFTGGVNCTQENGDGYNANYDLCDSGSSVGAAGAHTIGFVVPTNGSPGLIVGVAIAPPAPAVAASTPILMNEF